MRNMSLATTAVAMSLLSGLSGCGLGGDEEGRRTVVLIETGGPVEGREIELVAGIVIDELAGLGNTVEVIPVDGPNADVLAPLALPGVTGAGELDTEAVNSQARREAAVALLEPVTMVLSDTFETAPDFGSGRDLLGAMGRAAESEPDRLVLVSTSGGVHRVDGGDFLQALPEPAQIGVAVETTVELYGIGDVPAGDDVPSRAFTNDVVAYWQRSCELWPATECEVVR